MSRKIMIVDDEPAVLEMFLRALKLAGIQADAFTSGQEMLDKMGTGSSGLLITDIHMPGINGIELIRRVHEKNPRVEAIALSGFATEMTRNKLGRLGIFGFCDKPVDLPSFTRMAVNALKSDRLLRLEQGLDSPVSSLGRGRALIADDSPAFADMLAKLLKKFRYQVQTVSNGSEAYEDTLVNDYDLIILDINMPVMDGVDTVKAIREQDPHTFILTMSGEALPNDIAWAHSHGANKHLSKPFDMEKLEAALKEVDFHRIALEKRVQGERDRKRLLAERSFVDKIRDVCRIRCTARRLMAIVLVMVLCVLAGYAMDRIVNSMLTTATGMESNPGPTDNVRQLLNRIR